MPTFQNPWGTAGNPYDFVRRGTDPDETWNIDFAGLGVTERKPDGTWNSDFEDEMGRLQTAVRYGQPLPQQSVMINGQKFFRVGDPNSPSGPWRDTFYPQIQQAAQHDPTYGWVIPQQLADQVGQQSYGGSNDWLSNNLSWLGPALGMAAVGGAGFYGAGATGAEAVGGGAGAGTGAGEAFGLTGFEGGTVPGSELVAGTTAATQPYDPVTGGGSGGYDAPGPGSTGFEPPTTPQPWTPGPGTVAAPGLVNAIRPLMSGGGGGGGGGGGNMAGPGMNDLPSIVSALAGMYGLLNNRPPVDPARLNTMWNAGLNTYNTAQDPQKALYDRNLQRTVDTSRAGSSARGLAMSPYSAGVENEAVKNFNIDWENQQLNRQISGTNALVGAGTGTFNPTFGNQQTVAGQNQSSINALLQAYRELMGPGGWLNTVFGGGTEAPMDWSSWNPSWGYVPSDPGPMPAYENPGY